MASIAINVRLPAPPNAEAPHLTRFQSEDPPMWAGPMLLDIAAAPTDTVAQLKARVAERTGGAPPQWLRKGGAGGKGLVLEDAKTLAEYGLDYSMGIFEYLWVDSAENQERFKEEYEKVLSFVSTHRDFLNSDKADQNGA